MTDANIDRMHDVCILEDFTWERKHDPKYNTGSLAQRTNMVCAVCAILKHSNVLFKDNFVYFCTIILDLFWLVT